MAFRTIEITTKLDADTIRQLLKTNTYPKDGTWNVNEFDIRNPVEKTYSCEIKNDSFTLRARKTNQRRQSRPFGFGNIIQEKKKTRIRIRVVPHFGSMVTSCLFFLFSLMVMGWIISLDNPITIIPGLIPPIFTYLVYTLTLKYDAQDMELFVQKIVQEK